MKTDDVRRIQSAHRVALIECGFNEAKEINAKEDLDMDFHFLYVRPMTTEQLETRLIRRRSGLESKSSIAMKKA